MIEKLKYLLAGTLAFALAGAMVSCNNDEEALNEWTDTTYVFVKGQTLGNDLPRTFTVIETEGLTNTTPVVYTFKICLNRAAEADVTVGLKATAAGNIADMDENTMKMDADWVTIPAGMCESDTVTLTINPAFLGKKDAQGTYNPAVFTVAMGIPETADPKVKPSTKTNKVVVTLNKIVKAYLNLASGTPANSASMNRAGWSGELGPGVEGAIENLWDGKSTDIASNSSPWEFTINVGAVTEMLGFKTGHWGSNYAPSQLELITSVDGATWKSQGTLSISRASTQNVKFLKPVTARYLKYRVLAPDNRIDVTEFNVYIAKQ